MNKTDLIEAIKEGLRVVVLSVLPIIIGGLNPKTGEVAIEWRIVAIIGAVALLRFIDNLLHRYGKTVSESLPKAEISPLERGLTQF